MSRKHSYYEMTKYKIKCVINIYIENSISQCLISLLQGDVKMQKTMFPFLSNTHVQSCLSPKSPK